MKRHPLNKGELLKKLAALKNHPDMMDVVAEHADFTQSEPGEGDNVKSKVIDVIVENGQVVLVTDHAI